MWQAIPSPQHSGPVLLRNNENASSLECTRKTDSSLQRFSVSVHFRGIGNSRGRTVTLGDSQSDDTHSVTRFIERVKEEDPQAAEEIWQRYFARLLPLARAKLTALSHRGVDEEDILVSVFDRFFQAAKQDRFAHLHDRDDLWQILLMLTDRR